MSQVFAFLQETAGRHKRKRKLVNSIVVNKLKICLTFCMPFLHFLFAQVYVYNCAHQGSAKEVTPHEGGLLPTTGNSKGLQCCQRILLDVGLPQAILGPVFCTAGIADIQCMSNCRSPSHRPSHREWCLVLMIGYILSCNLTPDLEQRHPSTTTVPAVMSGESLLIVFSQPAVKQICCHLNNCDTSLFTTGLPSTSCKMLSKGFAKAFLSCFLSACHRSLHNNL